MSLLQINSPNNNNDFSISSFNKTKTKYDRNEKNITNSSSPSKTKDNFNFNTTINNLTSNSRSNNIKVVVRLRPLNEIEQDLINDKVGYICSQCNEENYQQITINNENGNPINFTFDRVFNIDSKQNIVYDYIGKETIEDVINGYNGTIFTYGQSGSGKTYTMYGNDIYDEESKGIIPRIM